jgi:pyrroline-5-carboxylate reductase
MGTSNGSPAETVFVGCGNLGMAILSRAVRAGVLVPAQTVVVEHDAGRRAEAASMGVHATAEGSAARGARTVLLAVKPQHFEDAARAIGPLTDATCVVSVMAGWSSAAIRAALGNGPRVLRAMPNTPAQVGMAMTAIARGAGATTADLAHATRLFSAVGSTCEIREDQIDAAVAAVGSAPAYLFLLAEAQIAAAVRMGIEPETARRMTTQTMLGAATLMATGERTPHELRAAVTSAGGTTAAAVRVFEERGFMGAVGEAMDAARARSAELGR